MNTKNKKNVLIIGAIIIISIIIFRIISITTASEINKISTAIIKTTSSLKSELDDIISNLDLDILDEFYNNEFYNNSYLIEVGETYMTPESKLTADFKNKMLLLDFDFISLFMSNDDIIVADFLKKDYGINNINLFNNLDISTDLENSNLNIFNTILEISKNLKSDIINLKNLNSVLSTFDAKEVDSLYDYSNYSNYSDYKEDAETFIVIPDYVDLKVTLKNLVNEAFDTSLINNDLTNNIVLWGHVFDYLLDASGGYFSIDPYVLSSMVSKVKSDNISSIDYYIDYYIDKFISLNNDIYLSILDGKLLEIRLVSKENTTSQLYGYEYQEIIFKFNDIDDLLAKITLEIINNNQVVVEKNIEVYLDQTDKLYVNILDKIKLEYFASDNISSTQENLIIELKNIGNFNNLYLPFIVNSSNNSINMSLEIEGGTYCNISNISNINNNNDILEEYKDVGYTNILELKTSELYSVALEVLSEIKNSKILDYFNLNALSSIISKFYN